MKEASLSEPALQLARTHVDENGPVAVHDVMDRLASAGHVVDRDVLIDALVDSGGIWWLAGAFVRDQHVLPGRSLTHRLNSEEIDGGFVDVDLDLHLLTLDESASFGSPLGTFVEEFRGRSTLLVGPAGCLDAWTANDVIAVRWAATGVLDIARIERPGDGDREVQILREAFEQEYGSRGVATLLDVLISACRSDGSAFATAPPLTELLARADLSVRGGEVADGSFDWAADADQRHQDYVQWLAEYYDVDLAEAEHLAILARSFLFEPAEDGVDLQACAAALRDPGATAAFLEEKTSRRPTDVQRLRALADATIATMAGEPPAGAHLVLARVAELEGDALRHAHEVDETLRIDPAFWPAFEDAAWIRADRGDLRGAAATLEQVVDDDHPRLLVLDRYSAPGRMAAERNESCPCGSGRKHKLCCGRSNGYRLVDRAPLLFEKAMWFASRPTQSAEIREMIDEALVDVDIDLAEFPRDLFDLDPVVTDAALFAAGLIIRFRDERGVMLPADERKLLDDWVDARMRILRVERWGDHADLTVTDVLTGEELVVGHHGADESIAPGRVVAAALLFDGERRSVLGWIQLADDAVDQLVSIDVSAIVRLVVETRCAVAAETLSRLKATTADRLAWLFPDADPAERDEQTVAELIENDHPELVAAITAGRELVRIEGGHEINPSLHLAVHEIVVEQILADDPREMWVTAVRLLNQGYDRHEILHMLGSTVSNQVFGMLGESQSYDREQHVEELAALPETWEAAREVHRSASPPGARHRGRHRRG